MYTYIHTYINRQEIENSPKMESGKIQMNHGEWVGFVPLIGIHKPCSVLNKLGLLFGCQKDHRETEPAVF